MCFVAAEALSQLREGFFIARNASSEVFLAFGQARRYSGRPIGNLD
jgi:hypothetical protein